MHYHVYYHCASLKQKMLALRPRLAASPSCTHLELLADHAEMRLVTPRDGDG